MGLLYHSAHELLTHLLLLRGREDALPLHFADQILPEQDHLLEVEEQTTWVGGEGDLCVGVVRMDEREEVFCESQRQRGLRQELVRGGGVARARHKKEVCF